MPRLTAPALDISTLITVPVATVFDAFFDPAALAGWWQVTRSVTTPRLLGPYALEWKVDDFPDELLGRLGGVFRGTIMHVDPEQGFFVADAYWLPPDGDPIGPMALEVAFTVDEGPGGESATRVRVTQNGFEESPRWRRYYEVIGVGWDRALRSLKILLEN